MTASLLWQLLGAGNPAKYCSLLGFRKTVLMVTNQMRHTGGARDKWPILMRDVNSCAYSVLLLGRAKKLTLWWERPFLLSSYIFFLTFSPEAAKTSLVFFYQSKHNSVSELWLVRSGNCFCWSHGGLALPLSVLCFFFSLSKEIISDFLFI